MLACDTAWGGWGAWGYVAFAVGTWLRIYRPWRWKWRR